jgi:hypothetical protein
MTLDAQIGWVPLLGNFEAKGDHVLFRGARVKASPPDSPPGAEPKEQVTHGILLSSQTLADGDVSAEIEFEKVTEDTVCELMVSYDAGAQHIVCAGLGGDKFAMFTIREFGVPDPRAWFYHHIGGGRAGLRAETTFRLEAMYRGATVTLRIDGVTVASSRVTSPLGRPRQVGILCKGDHQITVRKFTVKNQKPRAFVVMQFGNQYDDVYQDVVKGVCDAYEVSSLRADDVVGPGLIIADIVREIASAQLIIADITPSNPNVYFEVGYALALKKPTILLAKKGTSLPFDVAGFRVLFYEDSIGGKGKLEVGLRRHLEAILALDGASA